MMMSDGGVKEQQEEEKAPEVKKRMKDEIIVLDKTHNLPSELPKDLVYWNRCETLVDDEELITNK